MIYKNEQKLVKGSVKMVLADTIKNIVDPFEHHFQVGNIKCNYSEAKKGIYSMLI